MKKRILLFASILSRTLFAADDISLGEPIYGGSGCPKGTASVVLSPDAKTLSILFDRYQVEAGSGTGKDLERKSCNIAIPVRVPQGYSVSLFKVDYRGFNALPRGAHSVLNVSYFFAGQTGPVYSKTFYGEQNRDYYLSNYVTAESMIWSPCGKDTILRVNSDLRVKTNQYLQQALSTVDSTDVQAGLVYHVQFRRCTI